MGKRTQSISFLLDLSVLVQYLRASNNQDLSERKVVDDILGGAAAWGERGSGDGGFVRLCNYGEAYFMQMQIRSADEPMSIFYKCQVHLVE
jgi:DNA-directed RNA polymerase subunit M/transcription elongation factor TFIIS